MQSNLHVDLVYLHAVRVHYSNLLEAESMVEYYCSVPLNIIISVDNYTLWKGTEQSFEMATQTLLFKKTTKGQVNVQEGYFYR